MADVRVEPVDVLEPVGHHVELVDVPGPVELDVAVVVGYGVLHAAQVVDDIEPVVELDNVAVPGPGVVGIVRFDLGIVVVANRKNLK